MANNYNHSGTVFNIYWGHKHYLLMEWFTLKGHQEKKEYLNSVSSSSRHCRVQYMRALGH